MNEDAKSIGQPMAAFAGAPGACMCARARAAARKLTAHYEAHLAPHGVSLPQFGLLAAIAGAGEISATRLAEKVGLDPSTLSRTLRPLEQASLVESASDPANRRARILRLTLEGRFKAREAGRAWSKAQKTAMTKVDESLVQTLLDQARAL